MGEKWPTTEDVRLGDIFEMIDPWSGSAYYQVTGFRGKKLVVLRMIDSEKFIDEGIRADSPISGCRERERPIPGKFCERKDVDVPLELEITARIAGWDEANPGRRVLREWGHGRAEPLFLTRPEDWAPWSAQDIRQWELERVKGRWCEESELKWEGSWYLVDFETSGPDPERDSITAIRLAHIRNFETLEEQCIRIRSQTPQEEQEERIHGIIIRDLEEAILREQPVSILGAMCHLNDLERRPFVIHSADFLWPFLRKTNFYNEHLLNAMEDLAKIFLNGPDSLRVENLLEQLPPPPDDWTNDPPQDSRLAELYQLARALAYAEKTEWGLPVQA